MASADSKEDDETDDEREDAHQVHSPDDFRVHQRLGSEAALPLFLVVVVERRTEEEAFPGAGPEPRKLEVSYLEEDGTGFGDDDRADDREEKPCLDQDEHNADARSESDGTRVAHVDFRRGTVEPEVGEKRSGDGHRERKELVASRKERHVQVVAEDEIPANVSDDADKDHAAENRDGNEAVETVGEVRTVGCRRDDKSHESDERPVRQVDLEYIDRDEGDGQVSAEIRDELVAENGDDEAEEKVKPEADGARNSIGLFHVGGSLCLSRCDETLGLDFRNIVDGADCAEGDEDKERGDGVTVQLAGEKGDDDDHDDEKKPSHNRRSLGFAVLVKVRCRVRSLQESDIGGHRRKDEDDGEHRRKARPEKAAVKKGKFCQVINPFAKHEPNLKRL